MACHFLGRNEGVFPLKIKILGVCKMYDVNKAIEAQAEYCEQNGLPHFAPYHGVCYRCIRNIYQPVKWKKEGWRNVPLTSDAEEYDYITGITVEEAASNLVTGCPHCNRSYCD